MFEPEWGSLDILVACGAADPDSNSGSGTLSFHGVIIVSRKVVLYGAFCGILAPIVFLIFYLVAISQSPWYVFGEHYLSDLGVGEGAWAFNSGDIIAGLLAVPFALSIWYTLRPGWTPLLGSVMCAIGGVALVGVGIFTEDHGRTHYIVSVLFFLMAGLFQILLSWPLIKSQKTKKAGYVVTVLTMGTIVVAASIGANPLSETIAVFEILIWVLIVGIQIFLVALKEGRPPELEN